MRSSYLIAAALAAGAAAWIASGQFADPASDTMDPAGTAPIGASSGAATRAPTRVRAIRSKAEPVIQELVVLGHTAVNRRVELRSEVDGRVEEVLVDKGHPVLTGDAILRLAAEDRPARVAEARALVDQRQREFDAARSLSSKGFNSEIRLAEAQADLEAARAALARAEVTLDRLAIRAPFDGVLDRRVVEVGDYLSAADPVGAVVDLDPIKLVAQVTERSVADLALGQPGRAELVTGRALSGVLTYIAAAADLATRTFRIELSAPNPDRAVADGITARLIVPLGERRGHFVPPSALSLADDGSLGIKSIGDDDRVQVRPVTIIKDSVNGVWLAGLPEEIGLIVLGHEFVVENEVVEPVWQAPQLARAE